MKTIEMRKSQKKIMVVYLQSKKNGKDLACILVNYLKVPRHSIYLVHAAEI